MKKTATGLLLVALVGGLAAQAQTADDITTERHHTVLLENAKVRVFSVTLKPTERAFVRHEHNYAMITLNNCELVIWAAGQSDILNFRLDAGDVRFIFGGTSGLRNDRSQECHLITAEFLDPKVTTFGYQASTGGWDYGANVLQPPVDPAAKYENTLSLQLVTMKRVQLLPGDDLPEPSDKAEEVLIALTDLDLKLGSTKVRNSAGEVLWLPARKSKLVNSGGEPARFAILEFH